jgi:hypothetical protein
MPTCQQCQYFQPIPDHPAGTGTCCGEPPRPYPAMGQVGPLVRPAAAPQQMTIGLDPPVAHDRRACRFYKPEIVN